MMRALHRASRLVRPLWLLSLVRQHPEVLPPVSDLVRVERSGAHATLVIDHPKANAISSAVIRAFACALGGLEVDPSVGGLVVTGAGGRFFAAGADITEFPTAAAQGRPAGGGGQLCERLATLAKPSVAAVNGIAFGGGCEIAL